MKNETDERSAFPLNAPSCHDGTSSLKLSAELATYENNDGVNTRCASRTVIFDGNAWESELIWQAVALVIKEFGMDETTAKEALEKALRRLSELSGDCDPRR